MDEIYERLNTETHQYYIAQMNTYGISEVIDS